MYDTILGYLKGRTLKYEENFPLSQISSIGIGAKARFLVEPYDAEEFVGLIRFLRNQGAVYRVVGRLTNLLFCGDRYDGVIVTTKNISRKTVADCDLTADCGCPMPLAVRYAASLGLGGIEPLGTIPGSVGGCVAGNAGAFGIECSDALISAEIYLPEEDEIRTLASRELGFSYRRSMLKERDAYVVAATFRLTTAKESDVLARIGDILKKRAATQPVGARSLGSIFKRVGDVGAGYYIELAGLKGYSIGGAQVSSKHAGFIINRGGATSDDVLRLIDKVRSQVLLRLGVELEEEIEVIG